MRKLLCLVSVIVFTLSLCACSKDDNSKSVKIPDNSNSKASLTYEEAIVPFKSDEMLEKIYERAEKILANLQCIYVFYNGTTSLYYSFSDIEPITNETGVTKAMNELEEYFKSEPQYTEYMSNFPNPIVKDSYFKFISLAEEIYQAFADNPTKSVTDEINMTALEQYESTMMMGMDTSRATDFLSGYIGAVERNLWFIEAYCKLTPEEIENLVISDSTSYKHHMQNVASWCPSIEMKNSAEGLDLDHMILTLDSLIKLKDNANAIAVEAYGLMPKKLDVFNEFMENVTELYNKVRINRPEFNDVEYIEKHEFDLEPLEKIDAL